MNITQNAGKTMVTVLSTVLPTKQISANVTFSF